MGILRDTVASLFSPICCDDQTRRKEEKEKRASPLGDRRQGWPVGFVPLAREALGQLRQLTFTQPETSQKLVARDHSWLRLDKSYVHGCFGLPLLVPDSRLPTEGPRKLGARWPCRTHDPGCAEWGLPTLQHVAVPAPADVRRSARALFPKAFDNLL